MTRSAAYATLLLALCVALPAQSFAQTAPGLSRITKPVPTPRTSINKPKNPLCNALRPGTKIGNAIPDLGGGKAPKPSLNPNQNDFKWLVMCLGKS
ncbi:MAG: hypothetical protein AAGA78_05145 [Pseudomonadota bacterium]